MPGSASRWLAEELARALTTHRMPVDVVAGGLAVGENRAGMIMAGGAALTGEEEERAALLLNILVRMEVHCGHDPVLIAELLVAATSLLDDRSPLEAIAAGDLRRVREVVVELRALDVRWWRVGHQQRA